MNFYTDLSFWVLLAVNLVTVVLAMAQKWSFGALWRTPNEYIRYKKQDEVVMPAKRMVFLEENDWRDFNMGAFVIDAIVLRWQDPLTVWHAGAGSFGFADGHTEFRNWSPETVEYFNGYHPWGYIPTTEKGIEDVKWMQKGWSEPK